MKKILSFVRKNKKVLIASLGAGLFFSLIPSHAVYAWSIMGWVGDIVIGLGVRMWGLFTGVLLAAFGFFSGFLFYVVSGILTWATKICMTVPVIPDRGVDVITNAWGFTRDFSNMFLIIMLAIIGLTTILKLKDFETKKLLPSLIMIALLINFSPVLVGSIVDLSNIVTNFFLKSVGGFGDAAIMKIVMNNIMTMLKTLTGTFMDWGSLSATIGGVVGAIIFGVVNIAFFIFAAWILFLIVVLFFTRIIVLWILMILAPIAFVCYIFPGTKRYWKEWWQTLIQWAMVGIPVGFFLYLSFYILGHATGEGTDTISKAFISNNLGSEAEISSIGASTQAQTSGFDTPLSGIAALFANLLAPTVAFVMLRVGYKISKKNMPALASQIMDGAEKTAKVVGSLAVVAATGGAAAGLVAKGLGGAANVANRAGSVLDKVPVVGKPIKNISTGPAAWGLRRMEGKAIDVQQGIKGRAVAKQDSDAANIAKMNDKEFKNEVDKVRANKLPGGKGAGMETIIKAGRLAGKDLVAEGILTREEKDAGDMSLSKKGEKGFAREDLNMKKFGLLHSEQKENIEQFRKGQKEINNGRALIKEGTTEALGGEENLKTHEEDKQKRGDLMAINKNDRNDKEKDELKRLDEKLADDEIKINGNDKVVSGKGLVEAGESKQEPAKKALEEEISKVRDVSKMSTAMLSDPEMKSTLVDTLKGDQMAEIARKFGKSIVMGLQEEFNSRDAGKMARKNPNLVSWSAGNAGQELGFNLGNQSLDRKVIQREATKGRMASIEDLKIERESMLSKINEANGKDPNKPNKGWDDMWEKYYNKTTTGKEREQIDIIHLEQVAAQVAAGIGEKDLNKKPTKQEVDIRVYSETGARERLENKGEKAQKEVLESIKKMRKEVKNVGSAESIKNYLKKEFIEKPKTIGKEIKKNLEPGEKP